MRFRCSGRTEVQSQAAAAAAAASVCWEPLPKPATSDAISFKEGGIKQLWGRDEYSTQTAQNVVWYVKIIIRKNHSHISIQH